MNTNNLVQQDCHLINIRAWQKYYEELLAKNLRKYRKTLQNTMEQRDYICLLIREEGTEKHTLNLKNLRSPGSDNISIELI